MGSCCMTPNKKPEKTPTPNPDADSAKYAIVQSGIQRRKTLIHASDFKGIKRAEGGIENTYKIDDVLGKGKLPGFLFIFP